VFAPRDLDVRVFRLRPIYRRGLRQDSWWRDSEVVANAGETQRGENLLGARSARPTSDERFVIYGHKLLEDFEVALEIVRCGQQASQDAGFAENEWLPALPKAAECSESLSWTGLAFLEDLG